MILIWFLHECVMILAWFWDDFWMICLMCFSNFKDMLILKKIVFLQEFNDFHIVYFGLNRCIHHPKNCVFIQRFKLFLAYNLLTFWASILATKTHWFLPWIWAQNGTKKRPESFRKSLKFHCLSPGCHFGTPWLFLGSIFARLGALSGLIMAAGDVFCCQIVLGQVYLWLYVVIVTVISAPFKSRCARKHKRVRTCLSPCKSFLVQRDAS